jgi:hypothetical protein
MMKGGVQEKRDDEKAKKILELNKQQVWFFKSIDYSILSA